MRRATTRASTRAAADRDRAACYDRTWAACSARCRRARLLRRGPAARRWRGSARWSRALRARRRARAGRTARRPRRPRARAPAPARARRRCATLVAPARTSPRTTSSPRCCSRASARRSARAGTTGAGAAVVRARARRASACSPRIADGSGLVARQPHERRRGRAACSARCTPARRASTFEASLAVAGRSGTLRRRMRGTAAAQALPRQDRHADGVSTLAGLLRDAPGARARVRVPDERRRRSGARTSLRTAPCARSSRYPRAGSRSPRSAAATR